MSLNTFNCSELSNIYDDSTEDRSNLAHAQIFLVNVDHTYCMNCDEEELNKLCVNKENDWGGWNCRNGLFVYVLN